MERTDPRANAKQDANQNYTIIVVQGTLGTADTLGTALPMKLSGNPATGAGYVEVVNASSIGGTNVNVLTGTQQTLGTAGTVIGIGTITNIGQVYNAGTIQSIIPGTGITNLGKAMANVAGTTDVGVVALQIQTGTLGTAGSVADGQYFTSRVDNNGAQWTNLGYKLDSTNDSVTALVSSGTVTTGTLALITTVTTVSNLTNGTVRMSVGTLTTGTLQNLVTGTINALANGTISTITLGTGATSLGKAEDQPHVSGDIGVMMLGVRNDADADLGITDLDYTPIAVSSKGYPRIEGNIDHNATDSGRPVKIGGYASGTAPSDVGADGRKVNAWFKKNGALVVSIFEGTISTSPSSFPFTHLAGPGTTTIKSSAGTLHALVINSKSVGGALTIYNSVGTSANVIGVIDTTLSTTAFLYDAPFGSLTAAWAGNTGGDVTITSN